MTLWEYRTYTFEPGDKILAKLNELGAEGWEVIHIPPALGRAATTALFKRPKQ